MQKLLWVGSPFFGRSLASCGWDLRLHNFEHTAVLGWDDLVELADGPPDVLVVADKSRPPFVLGMEDFPCLTVFYCVDSHIHSWYPYYAQGFDVCLVSLKDHIPLFEHMRLPRGRIVHSPPFAKDNDLPPEPSLYAEEAGLPAGSCGDAGDTLLDAWGKRDWDLLFVGTVDSQNTPLRKQFMQALKRDFPGFTVTRGAYRTLYPRARLLLNHCELGDLNFRVFEALGCGGALLTPLIGHGLADLFQPDKDLFVYEMNNHEDAARKARLLLAEPARCLAAARSGFAEVNRYHRARHRAEAFTRYLLALSEGKIQNDLAYRLYDNEEDINNSRENSLTDMEAAESALCASGFQRIIRSRIANSREIRQSYLRFIYLLLAEQMEIALLREAYLQAAR